MNQLKILGVKIDNLSKKEIIVKIEDFLNEDKLHQIATVNPEIILKAKEDGVLFNILNNADLCLADGTGIRFAFWRFGRHLRTRMTGIDLMWKILEIANEKKLSVLLVANKGGLSTWQETREAILKVYPDIKISGVGVDPSAGHFDRSTELASLNIKEGHTTFDILFCNFGAPYQEKFIASLNRWSSWARLAVGVGGSFDFITGKIMRAPKIMRIFGFEWSWRFLQEPRYRAKRILKAVIIFPLRVLLNK
ncbi:MAG: Glycosyl transferase, WecB/TagA/CpsF family [Candidatus Moranbacteria bacterium GW2011_GWE1_35_17]|nr:MAG: Glycosyl transferase, WecB/TagA/CpsF family [Candidatus Moranbacteria bacterium GW2011_GWE1_35_17]KKP81806.1 MAG: Glycosyl transferase, WecB/TagA/CpsF family [Candidatus Moranbacteria bacterium GW2011_GWF1_35_5]